MEKFLQELAQFPNRENGLRKVTRYNLYNIMWYRTNLWTHSRRTAWAVQELTPFGQDVYGPTFDPAKAYALALVHDDLEMIMGDVQAGNKEKMGQDEINKLQVMEREAVDQLARRFSNQPGLPEYAALLSEALDKKSLETMVVNWADKYDAFGEALHEIFAGNELWTTNVVNEYGTISLPTDHYMNYFSKFAEKFPASISLFKKGQPLFQVPAWPDVRQLVQGRTPHTADSIHVKIGYQPYDLWIALTLDHGTKEDIADLYTKKE